MKMGGVAAIAGGVCWTVAAWAAALSPPYGTAGNVGNRFLAEDAWMLLALPLLAAGAWALQRAQADAVGSTGRTATVLFVTGVAIASASLALEALGIVVMQRPLFEIGARVLLVPMGGVLIGWASLRARSIPAAAALTLLVGAALLYVANSENWMASLAAVFGLGWVAVGATLSTGRLRSRPRVRRRPVPMG